MTFRQLAGRALPSRTPQRSKYKALADGSHTLRPAILGLQLEDVGEIKTECYGENRGQLACQLRCAHVWGRRTDRRLPGVRGAALEPGLARDRAGGARSCACPSFDGAARRESAPAEHPRFVGRHPPSRKNLSAIANTGSSTRDNRPSVVALLNPM
jgi:hypothetical protein